MFDIENVPVKILKCDLHISSTTSSLTKRIIDTQAIKGYPTLNLYQNSTLLGSYEGRRTANDIAHYVYRRIGIRNFDKIESLNEIKSSMHHLAHDIFGSDILAVVIALFPPAAKDSTTFGVHGQLAKTMKNLSQEFDLAVFKQTDNIDIIRHFSVEDDSLIIMNVMDNPHYHMDDVDRDIPRYSLVTPDVDLSENEVAKLLLEHLLPSSMHYSRNIQPLLQRIPIKLHALIFHGNNDEDETQILMLLENVAIKYKSQIIFIYVDIMEYHVSQIFGITQESLLPCIIVVDMNDIQHTIKYHFSEFRLSLEECEIDGEGETECLREDGIADMTSEDDLHSFFSMIIDGKLPRTLASESVEDIDRLNTQAGFGISSHVENIGALNFEEKVLLDDSTDSLVYSQSPWSVSLLLFDNDVMMNVGGQVHSLQVPGACPRTCRHAVYQPFEFNEIIDCVSHQRTEERDQSASSAHVGISYLILLQSI